MTQKDFGERVKKLRNQLGISQMELSLRCEHITTSYICGLERGENNPTYETLKRLAGGLGITVEQLIHEDEPQLQFDTAMNKLIAHAMPLSPDERMDLVDIAKIFRRRKDRL